jgi:hypothetical protein
MHILILTLLTPRMFMMHFMYQQQYMHVMYEQQYVYIYTYITATSLYLILNSLVIASI